MSTAYLPDDLVVVNLGLHDFADALAAQGARVLHVDWTPPHEVDPHLAELLDRMG